MPKRGAWAEKYVFEGRDGESKTYIIEKLVSPISSKLAAEINALLDGYGPHYKISFGPDFFERCVHSAGGVILFIAYESELSSQEVNSQLPGSRSSSNKIVAHSSVVFNGEDKTACALHNVFTLPAHRRRGLSKRMVRFCMEAMDHESLGEYCILGTGSPYAAKTYIENGFVHLAGGLYDSLESGEENSEKKGAVKGYNPDDLGEWIMVRRANASGITIKKSKRTENAPRNTTIKDIIVKSIEKMNSKKECNLKKFYAGGASSEIVRVKIVKCQLKHYTELVLLFNANVPNNNGSPSNKLRSIGIDNRIQAEDKLVGMYTSKKDWNSSNDSVYVIVSDSKKSRVIGLTVRSKKRLAQEGGGYRSTWESFYLQTNKKENSTIPHVEEALRQFHLSQDEQPAKGSFTLMFQAAMSFFLACCLYANTYDVGFLYDDEPAIVRNPIVARHSQTTIHDVFKHDFWGHPLHLAGSHKSFRPITTLTFRVQAQLSSQFSSNSAADNRLPAAAMHLFNIFLFGIVSCLFCVVAHLLCPESGSRNSFRSMHLSTPQLATILFIAHPIHTEAVANTVGRCELLCCFFVFVSLILYIKAAAMTYGITLHGRPKIGWSASARGSVLKSTLMHVLSLVLAVCAMLSKEQGITVVGLFVVYDTLHLYAQACADLAKTACADVGTVKNITVKSLFEYLQAALFHRREANLPARAFDKTAKQNGDTRGDPFFSLRGYSARLLLNTFVLLMVLQQRLKINKSMPKFSPSENLVASFVPENPDDHDEYVSKYYTRFLSYSYVNAMNLWFLILPHELTIDWAMGNPSLPDVNHLVTTVMDIRMVPVILAVITIAYFATELTRDSLNDRLVVMMGLAMMVIPFVPSSNAFFPVGFVWAERVLFTPSSGFCILLAFALKRLEKSYPLTEVPPQRLADKKTIFLSFVQRRAPMVFFIAFYVVRTFLRNEDWRSPFSLFQSAAAVLPNNPRAHHGLGTLYAHNVTTWGKAEHHFRTAMVLLPTYGETMNSLALLTEKMAGKEVNTTKRDSMMEAAKQLYRDAHVASPGLARPLTNLANLLQVSSIEEEVREAEKVLNEASMLPTVVSIQRYNVLTRLGIVRMRLGKYRKAAEAFKMAIQVKEASDGTAQSSIAQLHMAKSRFSEAEASYNKALSKAHNRNVAENDLAVIRDYGSEHLGKSVRISMCERLLPEIRKKYLAKVDPTSHFDDADLEANKPEVILVLEDESIDEKVSEFCKTNMFGDESCANLLNQVQVEENRLSKGSPGEIRYNVIVDNTVPLAFSIDGKSITIAVAPKDDPEAIADEYCSIYNFNSHNDDCKVLRQHIAATRDRAIELVGARLKLDPWNIDGICKDYVYAKARELHIFIKNGRFAREDRQRSDSLEYALEARQTLGDYSNITLGLVGRLFYEEAQTLLKIHSDINFETLKAKIPLLPKEDIFLAKKALTDAIFYGAFMVYEIGGDQASKHYNVNLDELILMHLGATNALPVPEHKSVHPSVVWEKAWKYQHAAPVSSKVAIVSLCQYDPLRTPLTMLSAHNKVNYAQAFGYPLFIETVAHAKDRPPAWEKVKIVQKYMEMKDRFDWVVWTDCDSFFMNKAGSDGQRYDLRFLLSDQILGGAHKDLVLSKDGTMLNTGFFAVRTNSDWSETLLKAVYGPTTSDANEMVFVRHPWWEQASMYFLFEFMNQHELSQRVHYFPQRVFNGYPKEYSNNVHGHYENGDFVVAFSGCATYVSQEKCNELFALYSKAAQ